MTVGMSKRSACSSRRDDSGRAQRIGTDTRSRARPLECAQGHVAGVTEAEGAGVGRLFSPCDRQLMANGLLSGNVVVASSLVRFDLPLRSGRRCVSRVQDRELADFSDQHVSDRDVLQPKHSRSAEDLHHPVISDTGIGHIGLQGGPRRLQPSTNTSRVAVLEAGGEKECSSSLLGVGQVRIHRRDLPQRLPFEVAGPTEELRLHGTVARNVPGVTHAARLTEIELFYV